MQNNLHAPIHFDCPGQYYFLTAGTYQRIPLWNSITKLAFLQKLLLATSKELKLQLICYSLLPNHYHLIFHYPQSTGIHHFTKILHGRSAAFLNKSDQISNRRVWYQYWDTCIRRERDYLQNLNYVFYNPVKHGLVKKVSDWKFTWARQDINLRHTPSDELYPWDNF